MSRSAVPRIIKRDGALCHYCLNSTNRQIGSKRQATTEHIIPRSMGGRNSMSNYILTCAECNVERGNGLFYCVCEICSQKIQSALSCDKFVRGVFDAIVRHNKVRVYRAGNGKWAVRMGYSRASVYDSWNEAITAAVNNNDAPIRRRDYA